MKVQVNKLTKQAKAGFSLVELLVVIAVIGIMAAIAIPIISNINENARIAKAKRNAQNVVSVANSAQAAGGTVATGSVTALINALQAGVNGTGQFSNTIFKVDLTDGTEETEAAVYVEVDPATGVISYDPSN